jgi:adenylate cyclase class 2
LREREFPDGTTEHSLTYKGPKIDANTKTRQEIEVSITDAKQWESMLIALGFRRCASVQKFRRRAKLIVNHRHIEIVFDTLPALPESGRTFLELETLATEETLEECRTLLLDIAEQLELGESIRDSYLKLVQDCATA